MHSYYYSFLFFQFYFCAWLKINSLNPIRFQQINHRRNLFIIGGRVRKGCEFHRIIFPFNRFCWLWNFPTLCPLPSPLVLPKDASWKLNSWHNGMKYFWRNILVFMTLRPATSYFYNLHYLVKFENEGALK